MIAWLLAKQIAVLFLIMGLGFLLVKLKLAKADDSRILSVVTIYLIMPCLVINAFQIDYTDELRNGFLLAIGAAVITQIILFVMCSVLGKVLKLNAVEKASIIYSNAGNLIIPLITAVLGPEWVFYTSAYICVQMIMMWTHGQSLLEGKAGFNWKKIVTNINMISIFAGLILFFARIKMPELISNVMGTLSGMIGPISMIMLGMLLAKLDFREVFSGRRIYLIAFLKMILFPGMVLLTLKYSGLASLVPDGTTILLISLLAVIAPSATTVTQLAQLYDNQATYASAINAVTTLVCIATMPLMVLLYQL